MRECNTILIKSKQFALRIVRLYKYLCENKKKNMFFLSKLLEAEQALEPTQKKQAQLNQKQISMQS